MVLPMHSQYSVNNWFSIDKDTAEYECYLKQPIESTKIAEFINESCDFLLYLYFQCQKTFIRGYVVLQ